MPFIITSHQLIWRQGREVLRIEPWGPDALRVRGGLNPDFPDDDPLSALLTPAPASPPPDIHVDGAIARIRNGRLTAEVGEDGRVRFLRDGREEALAEMSQRVPHPPRRFKSGLEGDAFRLLMRFKAYEGERIYGMGLRRHGLFDQKGAVLELLQRNGDVNVPFLLSSRGYGFLWNNPAVGQAAFGSNETRWEATSTRKLDYWITLGETPAQIVQRYVDATGHAPIAPAWATGLWQCKLRYKTQDEVLAIAREYKERGLPLSVIVIDYFHWTLMGEWRFNPTDWPDPAGMVRELAEMGVRVMVSIWPTVNLISPSYRDMRERGLLVETHRGLPATWMMVDSHAPGQPSAVTHYDSTHPDARAWIWERVKENYLDIGIDIYWLDADEPELQPTDPENMRFYLGNGLEVINLYPLMHARAFYEGMRAAGQDEIFNLSRSAWAGSQRYAASVWSGDIASTFQVFRTQIPAALNLGLAGIPWWQSDIGGFFDGDPGAPVFRELLVRWFQFAVFTPVLRMHGFRKPGDIERFWESGGPNELWSFGDEVYAILRDYLFLRERIRPQVLGLMTEASATGAPPMRPFFFEFPEDETAWSVSDAYLFGPDLLVAPVQYQGETSRLVYLPEGASWRDAWTDQRYEGGQWITANAPLERIPLFLRGDAHWPIRGR